MIKPKQTLTSWIEMLEMPMETVSTEEACLDAYIKALHKKVPAEKGEDTLGIKFDSLKPRWSLVPRGVMKQVVEVLTFGAAKYSSDNWMYVDPEKYYNALHRHIDAWRNGEKLDAESGKHHLAHALCCLLFMLWHDDNPKPNTKAI